MSDKKSKKPLPKLIKNTLTATRVGLAAGTILSIFNAVNGNNPDYYLVSFTGAAYLGMTYMLESNVRYYNSLDTYNDI